MNLGFEGRTVIVTGGAKGIGAGITQVFAEEGAHVIVDYRSDPERCEAFIKEVQGKTGNRNIYGIQADVSDPAQVQAIFDFAEETFGRLDVLINNAGSGPSQMFWDISLDDWNRMLNNNLTAYFMMCQEFVKRLMAAGKGGHIVNVLSKASLTTTTKGRACYVTNKTAQMGLTKQLAVDLTDKGIICNGIMPGTVRSEMGKSDLTRANITPEQEEAYYQARLKRLPMGRYGEPDEFGKMVAFLASEQCQLAVGAVIDFTGGMMLGF